MALAHARSSSRFYHVFMASFAFYYCQCYRILASGVVTRMTGSRQDRMAIDMWAKFHQFCWELLKLVSSFIDFLHGWFENAIGLGDE